MPVAEGRADQVTTSPAARSRILYLSQCLPYPPHSGVTNRGFNILRQLASGFDVRLLAFSRRNHQPDRRARQSAARRLAAFLEETYEPVPIPGEQSRTRRLWDHVRSLLTGRAYTYYEYRTPAFARQLRAAVERWKPDLVHVDSLDLYGWIDELPPVPTTCTHHNMESELLRLRARYMQSSALRRYLKHQADLVEAVERNHAERFALNLMMSDLDAKRLERLAPGARTAVVPNGVDVDSFRPGSLSERVPGRVVFLGPTYMFPNRDAVEFLLDAIWPRIRRRLPDATLHLIGKSPDGERARYDSVPGVRCLGYVEDIRPAFAAAECCVVPLRVGGGTRLKILDSWAMGTPVVSTAVGCEGLEACDGDNILIRDDGSQFAEAVLDVLLDEDLRLRLGSNGRATAEEVYDWEVVGAKLRELYTGLLNPVP